jgi:hypothetical protein
MKIIRKWTRRKHPIGLIMVGTGECMSKLVHQSILHHFDSGCTLGPRRCESGRAAANASFVHFILTQRRQATGTRGRPKGNIESAFVFAFFASLRPGVFAFPFIAFHGLSGDTRSSNTGRSDLMESCFFEARNNPMLSSVDSIHESRPNTES